MDRLNDEYRYRELADFLKTRRAKIKPSQVGLPATNRRRTPGLRREEVAQLAGIGLSWYTWLEQGRPIHVSSAVVDSLARVLLLNRDERIHLYQLAGQPLISEISSCQNTVNVGLQHLLDHLALCPALITDQKWNVVAWNKEANALFGNYSDMNARERNIVWSMFTNERYRTLFPEWERYAKHLVSGFRATCGEYIEDPWLRQFVEELKENSREFALWWPLHEIDSSCEKHKQLLHPELGFLDFEISNFKLEDDAGFRMVVHVPDPTTDTEEKMKRLL